MKTAENFAITNCRCNKGSWEFTAMWQLRGRAQYIQCMTYLEQTRFVLGGKELLSHEGTTQGRSKCDGNLWSSINSTPETPSDLLS